MLARRAGQALLKRMPGRSRRRRIRFEDVMGRISDKAQGRPLRLTLVGRDNICRSAFGERLLRLRLAGLPVDVASAGHVPRRGASPSAATLAAAAPFGVDLAGHSSSALSVADLERADVLILFDDDTEWRLRQMSPDFAAETVTLPEATGAGTEAFPAIAAALTRLARVVEGGLRPRPSEASAGAAPPCRQAA